MPGEPITPEELGEFARRLAAARAACEDDPELPEGVAWMPQAGSQTAFLTCPIEEVLFHGTRGGCGKTDSLLMAFAKNVGRGFGAAWRGIIFRQTYPQLADIVAKSEKWFRRIFPQARFTRSGTGGMRWEWPTGEVLLFRHMARPETYWDYHGHEYPFVGWEELANWALPDCFKSMIACCRSSEPGVPRMIRATTNPYGVGHNWIKERYRLDGQWWKTVITRNPRDAEGRREPDRCAIHGHISENKILLRADPDYPTRITAAATSPAMAEAWTDGSWDFVAGGMFDDVWTPENLIEDFDVPVSWRIDRAFDWGSSKPFSVGWYAVSDGSDLRLRDGRVISTVRGDVFRVREWYGCKDGQPNVGLRMTAKEIARGIVEREVGWGWRSGNICRVSSGPADSSIFASENGVCLATDMMENVEVRGHRYPGVSWLPADKSPGSRVLGWLTARERIKVAKARDDGYPREEPGFFVQRTQCPEFLRTFLTLPRDQKNMDDVNTEAEDHIGDEVRYRLRAAGTEVRGTTTTGMY